MPSAASGSSKAWAAGDLVYILTQLWADQGVDVEGNALVGELIREKIRAIVKDPETAAALSPHDHPFGAKRPCLDTNYYATYNRPNVTLVNLRQEPIKPITASGITTDKRTFDIDVIVFATGFDAMTGAIMAVHPITGRGGKSLSDVWANGPQTYLGLTVAGFPNLFMITGPGSPSVLSNMAVSIEQHVDWVVDRLIAMREAGFTDNRGDRNGAGRLGAPHGRLRDAHAASAGEHLVHGRQRSRQGAGRDALYRRRRPLPQHLQRGRQPRHARLQAHRPRRSPEQCNDGEIVRLQPDVRLVLGMLAEMNLPPIESLGAQGARDFVERIQQRPSRRPAGRRGRRRHAARRRWSAALSSLSAGDAGAASDRGLFPWRRLGARRRAIRRSVLPRHVPAHRDDLRQRRLSACARTPLSRRRPRTATRRRAGSPSTRPSSAASRGPVMVAGWSAGGNIAAVTCQLARDRGGPQISGQLLVCPVTDCTFDRPSYNDNATGYFLTRSLMYWFWDLYCSPADRTDPRVSPLRGKLEGLPPAFVVTCEFDPLRDEGVAYAEALAAAGVPVEQLKARGHFHSSLTMVDVVITGVRAACRWRMPCAASRGGGFRRPCREPRSRPGLLIPSSRPEPSAARRSGGTCPVVSATRGGPSTTPPSGRLRSG